MRTIPEEWRHAQSSTSPLFDPCTLGGTALSPGFGTNDEDQTVKLATIGDIPNHGPAFWRRLERAMPDYAERKDWLAANGAHYDL